jgi:hypothetical protein
MFLMTGWAEMSALAGKGKPVFMSAVLNYYIDK